MTKKINGCCSIAVRRLGNRNVENSVRLSEIRAYSVNQLADSYNKSVLNATKVVNATLSAHSGNLFSPSACRGKITLALIHMLPRSLGEIPGKSPQLRPYAADLVWAGIVKPYDSSRRIFLHVKKSRVMSAKVGSRIAPDQTMYPKKLGITTPCLSAIDFTMKFGALPM